jgi:hypothetical protein
MFTVWWCYLLSEASKKDGVDDSVSADLTGQANHVGVTIDADIIEQKQPENYGRTSRLVSDQLTADNPIDPTCWQVANRSIGRIGLINSGGGSTGSGDLGAAVRTAVINRRAGHGLISGRTSSSGPWHMVSNSFTLVRTSPATRASPSPDPSRSAWSQRRPRAIGCRDVRVFHVARCTVTHTQHFRYMRQGVQADD